jgi:transposase-like protein
MNQEKQKVYSPEFRESAVKLAIGSECQSASYWTVNA